MAFEEMGRGRGAEGTAADLEFAGGFGGMAGGGGAHLEVEAVVAVDLAAGTGDAMRGVGVTGVTGILTDDEVCFAGVLASPEVADNFVGDEEEEDFLRGSVRDEVETRRMA